ncbi:MAG: enoyl-CoA hydratase/isomerase family protein, partial [Actinobacteria bacterium]|nr:enoyl-CoA hydratase/isomerase family protein [Actinomycetota bacterium]
LAMDDGNKNALDTDAFAAITEAFDGAGDARAIVLTGRDDIFSAGLNVKFLASAGRDGVSDLLVAFGRTLMRVWLEPRPTVAACAGHALAAGTMLAMACDHAVAASGPHWWGLTETQINFEMPVFGLALARHNVRADRVDDLILPGARIPAEQAVEVGYADELVAQHDVLARAQSKAAELAALPAGAYAGTKRRLRGEVAEAVLLGLEDDIEALLASFPGDGDARG